MPEGTFRAPLNLNQAMAALDPTGRAQGEMPFDGDPGVTYDDGRVLLGGSGPLIASTSTDLLPHPAIVWDRGFYYRRLGLRWPYNPTHAELRRAGVESRAWEHPHVMYGLKVLLGKFGAAELENYRSLFLHERHFDPFVVGEINSEAARVAAELGAQGVRTTPKQVREQMGFRDVPEDEDIGATRLSTLSGVSGSPFPWSFYLIPPVRDIDLDVLADWQSELIRAVGENRRQHGVNLEGFAVGLAEGQDWVCCVEEIDGNCVFFVDITDIPTPRELSRWADEQVDSYLNTNER